MRMRVVGRKKCPQKNVRLNIIGVNCNDSVSPVSGLFCLRNRPSDKAIYAVEEWKVRRLTTPM
jgi:hypothetical protein